VSRYFCLILFVELRNKRYKIEVRRSGLPIWLFFKPDFEILAFFERLRLFLEIKKARQNLSFFQFERLGSGKTLSNLHIYYKYLLTRVCDHAGCKEYCNDFTVAVKTIDTIDKKQMYDSVITG